MARAAAKQQVSKDVKITATEKKARRFHPGTVARREIKKYQKSNQLLLRKLPFFRLVRAAVQDDSARFHATALNALQEGVESYLVQLLQDANRVAVTAAQRKTVMTKDIMVAYCCQYHPSGEYKELINTSFFKKPRELDGISRPAIRRLARRSGVERISEKVYDVIRAHMSKYVFDVVRVAVLYKDHARRKTVFATDIVQALKKQGQSLYGYGV